MKENETNYYKENKRKYNHKEQYKTKELYQIKEHIKRIEKKLKKNCMNYIFPHFISYKRLPKLHK